MKQLIDALNQIVNLPAVALAPLFCISLGYMLRFLKTFNNDRIPIACWLAGGVVYPLLAGWPAPANPLMVQIGIPFGAIARNVIIGLILGFVSWLFHNQVLKRIEDSDFLAKWFPGVSTLLTGPAAPTPMPPAPPADPPKSP